MPRSAARRRCSSRSWPEAAILQPGAASVLTRPASETLLKVQAPCFTSLAAPVCSAPRHNGRYVSAPTATPRVLTGVAGASTVEHTRARLQMAPAGSGLAIAAEAPVRCGGTPFAAGTRPRRRSCASWLPSRHVAFPPAHSAAPLCLPRPPSPPSYGGAQKGVILNRSSRVLRHLRRRAPPRKCPSKGAGVLRPSAAPLPKPRARWRRPSCSR